jgi:hypothetical protein
MTEPNDVSAARQKFFEVVGDPDAADSVTFKRDAKGRLEAVVPRVAPNGERRIPVSGDAWAWEVRAAMQTAAVRAQYTDPVPLLLQAAADVGRYMPGRYQGMTFAEWTASQTNQLYNTDDGTVQWAPIAGRPRPGMRGPLESLAPQVIRDLRREWDFLGLQGKLER